MTAEGQEGGYSRLTGRALRVFVVLAVLAGVGVALAVRDQSNTDLPPPPRSTAGLPWVPAPQATALPGSLVEANDMGDPTFIPAPVLVVARERPRVWRVSSTVYCLPGTTASGQKVRPGLVAVSYADWPRLRGTRWRVIEGPPEIKGRTFLVADKGPAAHFDVWFGDRPNCPTWGRYTYGRRPATVVPA